MPKLHKSEGDINISPQREAWQKEHLDAGKPRPSSGGCPIFPQAGPLHPVPQRHGAPAAASGSRTCRAGATWTSTATTSTRSVSPTPRSSPPSSDSSTSSPFCTRRYTNRVGRRPGEEAGRDRARATSTRSSSAPAGPRPIGMALKLARIATGRHKTISMWDSFHGAIARRDLGRRRGDLPPGHRPAAARDGACAAARRISLHLRLRAAAAAAT